MTVVRTPHVSIRVDGGRLEADLSIPEGATGLVVFAHGSGSSRLSPRNRHVAGILGASGLATVLVDLLTGDEELIDDRTARLRFDIDLLTRRVVQVLQWVRAEADVGTLPIGLFGASTGAAAALAAAALEPQLVHAVVSRGGRPDLAGAQLPHVQAPTLLIVGERDHEVLGLNQRAAGMLRCEHRIAIVPGATHLFEEPGTLDRAARLAAEWFGRHLVRSGVAPGTADAPPRTPHGWTGPFRDRVEAGETLATWVESRMELLQDPLVLALPRGGVEVAVPVARRIHAPLDVIVARKVGAPLQRELALGAVDEDGVAAINPGLRRELGISDEELGRLVSRSGREATERAVFLRRHRPAPNVRGRDVVLVDDGYATGMTAIAAAGWLRRHGAGTIMLAVPVAPRELVEHRPDPFDAVVCPYTPEPFHAVGAHYVRFEQTGDDAVLALLDGYASELALGDGVRG